MKKGCCCPTIPPWPICTSVCLCGERPEGLTVTVTGPGGYSETCVTGPDGKCCVDAVGEGDYTSTVTIDGQDYSHTVALSADGPGKWSPIVATKLNITLVYPCKRLEDLAASGLTLEVAQGAFSTTVATDGDGKASVCLPTAAAATVQVVDPPCPYQAFDPVPTFHTNFGKCDSKAVLALQPNPAIVDPNPCFCRSDFLAPWDGYLLELPCGVVREVSIPDDFCELIEDDAVLDPSSDCLAWGEVACDPYGHTRPVIPKAHGATRVRYQIGCGGVFTTDRLWLRVTWGAWGARGCSSLSGGDLGDGAIANAGDAPCGLDFCGDPYPTDRASAVLELELPLGGVYSEGLIDVSCTIPSHVIDRINPDMAYQPSLIPVPCPGVARLQRSWCGMSPDDPIDPEVGP